MRLKAIKLQKAHILTEKNKAARLKKVETLLTRLANGKHLDVLWTDEKVFSIEQAFNKQNDRILASSVSAANSTGRIVETAAHPKCMMVSPQTAGLH